MYEAGYKIIGIVEFDGGLSNPSGMDIDALWEFRYRTGSIHGFPGAEAMDPQQLFVSDCDILVPAAIENVITSRNADSIKCRILCEGANGPTTAAADEILAEKKIFVIPDILANASSWNTSCAAHLRMWCATPRRTASTTGLPPTCSPLTGWHTA
jgi:glutamate dehydrogenase (NAD(P)+)